MSGIRRISRFPIGRLRTTVAGTVDFIPVEEASAPALSERARRLVIEEAVAEAGIGRKGDFPGPLFLALPPVEMEWPQRQALAAASGANESVGYDDLLRAAATGKFAPLYERFLFGSVAEHLADRFGTKGSPVATSTACASGGTAIQLGVEAIRRGEAEAALCVGTDASINPESLIRFSLLSALSTRNDPPSAAARPFSKDRDGFVMAEGAGALVIESLAHARARGARILGVIEGCGEMADGFHRTRSSPDGKPIIACMPQRARRCRRDARAGGLHQRARHRHAGERQDGVGRPSPHVFGERAAHVPISSNKSMIGHTLTAAGTVEAVFTPADDAASARCRRRSTTRRPIRRCRSTACPTWRATPAWTRTISNSFGFGGQNVCLVHGRRARVMAYRALVIGGRRGIGAAVVRALLARGDALTFTYRTDPGDLDAMRAGHPGASISTVRLDLADRAAVEPSPTGLGRRSTRWCMSAARPTTCWPR